MPHLLMTVSSASYPQIQVQDHCYCIFSSPELKFSENYCHSPGVVVFVVGSIKLYPFFSHAVIDSCYLNFVATGDLHCLLTTLVINVKHACS